MAAPTVTSLAKRVEALERLAVAMLRPDGHAAGCEYRDRRGPDVPCNMAAACDALRAFAADCAGRERRDG